MEGGGFDEFPGFPGEGKGEKFPGGDEFPPPKGPPPRGPPPRKLRMKGMKEVEILRVANPTKCTGAAVELNQMMMSSVEKKTIALEASGCPVRRRQLAATRLSAKRPRRLSGTSKAPAAYASILY